MLAHGLPEDRVEANASVLLTLLIAVTLGTALGRLRLHLQEKSVEASVGGAARRTSRLDREHARGSSRAECGRLQSAHEGDPCCVSCGADWLKWGAEPRPPKAATPAWVITSVWHRQAEKIAPNSAKHCIGASFGCHKSPTPTVPFTAVQSKIATYIA